MTTDEIIRILEQMLEEENLNVKIASDIIGRGDCPHWRRAELEKEIVESSAVVEALTKLLGKAKSVPA